MPPPPMNEPSPEKSLPEVVADLGLYPLDAFMFVQEGLAFTVKKIHGIDEAQQQKEQRQQQQQQQQSPQPPRPRPRGPESTPSRHISGRDLCEGLRELALNKWGLMARAVLARWGVTSTLDFGRIVFAMVDNGWMQKTDRDSIEDFRNVYDFKTTFDAGYRIEQK